MAAHGAWPSFSSGATTHLQRYPPSSVAMRIFDPRRALSDDAGVEGFTVTDDRVLSVLVLTLVTELMREVATASLPAILSEPRVCGLWPYPLGGFFFGSEGIHVLVDKQRTDGDCVANGVWRVQRAGQVGDNDLRLHAAKDEICVSVD